MTTLCRVRYADLARLHTEKTVSVSRLVSHPGCKRRYIPLQPGELSDLYQTITLDQVPDRWDALYLSRDHDLAGMLRPIRIITPGRKLKIEWQFILALIGDPPPNLPLLCLTTPTPLQSPGFQFRCSKYIPPQYHPGKRLLAAVLVQALHDAYRPDTYTHLTDHLDALAFLSDPEIEGVGRDLLEAIG